VASVPSEFVVPQGTLGGVFGRASSCCWLSLLLGKNQCCHKAAGQEPVLSQSCWVRTSVVTNKTAQDSTYLIEDLLRLAWLTHYDA